MHTRGKPVDPEVSLDALAAGTPGFTGAELSNLINEAALLAARRGKTTIGQAELEEGIMRAIAGPERKTRVFSEQERAITAYHEIGHALVGHFLEHTDPVHKISIVSRGQALGFTVSLPTEDRFLTSRSALLDQLAMMLGGRAAEELVFDEITTGAANDLEKATAMSRQMVTRYGMSERLGARVFGSDPHLPFLGRELGGESAYSEEMAQEIDEEIHRLIEEAHQRALAVLTAERGGPPSDRRDPDRAGDDRQGPVRASRPRSGHHPDDGGPTRSTPDRGEAQQTADDSAGSREGEQERRGNRSHVRPARSRRARTSADLADRGNHSGTEHEGERRMKGSQKPKKLQKKAAQKTLKERRSDKRAAAADARSRLAHLASARHPLSL